MIGLPIYQTLPTAPRQVTTKFRRNSDGLPDASLPFVGSKVSAPAIFKDLTPVRMYCRGLRPIRNPLLYPVELRELIIC